MLLSGSVIRAFHLFIFNGMARNLIRYEINLLSKAEIKSQ